MRCGRFSATVNTCCGKCLPMSSRPWNARCRRSHSAGRCRRRKMPQRPARLPAPCCASPSSFRSRIGDSTSCVRPCGSRPSQSGSDTYTMRRGAQLHLHSWFFMWRQARAIDPEMTATAPQRLSYSQLRCKVHSATSQTRADLRCQAHIQKQCPPKTRASQQAYQKASILRPTSWAAPAAPPRL